MSIHPNDAANSMCGPLRLLVLGPLIAAACCWCCCCYSLPTHWQRGQAAAVAAAAAAARASLAEAAAAAREAPLPAYGWPGAPCLPWSVPPQEWFSTISNKQQQQQQQQQPHQGQQQQQQLYTAQQQQQQQQQELHALDSSELRSLLLQCRAVLSLDLGTTKTGLAAAVRRPPLRCLWAAAAALPQRQQQQQPQPQQQQQPQQQPQQQQGLTAAEGSYLWASDLSSLFSVSPLKLLQHERSNGSLLRLLLQQQQQQHADLLLLGLPLNPCLPPRLRYVESCCCCCCSCCYCCFSCCCCCWWCCCCTSPCCCCCCCCCVYVQPQHSSGVSTPGSGPGTAKRSDSSSIRCLPSAAR